MTYWPVLLLYGKLEPFNNGDLDIFVCESEVDCEPVEEDVDGDLVQDGKSAITVFCHLKSQPDMTPMVMVRETTLSLRWPRILILKQ